MGFDDGLGALGFAHTISEESDEFLKGLELLRSWLVVVEIADEADADADVVEVITVNMAAGELNFPAIADFDLSISGGRSVPDDEVVGEAVLHFSDAAVVVVERFRVALSGAAIVDHDVLPASFGDGRTVNLITESGCDVFSLRF
jgi:hypothetical protein